MGRSDVSTAREPPRGLLGRPVANHVAGLPASVRGERLAALPSKPFPARHLVSDHVGGAQPEAEGEATGELGGAVPVEDHMALEHLDVALEALQR